MELKKCHCNGSRGTDCDWCGGSGWKEQKKTIICIKNNDTNKKEIIDISNDKNDDKNKKKNYVERLEILRIDILGINTSYEISSYQYLKKRIIKFNNELNKIKNRVSKNEKKLFEDIKNKTEKLIDMLEKKIKFKKTTMKNSSEKDIFKSPTLNNKFSSIFKELKKKLK